MEKLGSTPRNKSELTTRGKPYTIERSSLISAVACVTDASYHGSTTTSARTLRSIIMRRASWRACW